MPGPEQIALVVVINGQPFMVEANVNAPLRTVVEKALADSNNTGQPAENWELRNEAGALLELGKKVGDFHFAPDTKLFLSLKAGVGG
jgi:uncharacterized protein DUF2604